MREPSQSCLPPLSVPALDAGTETSVAGVRGHEKSFCALQDTPESQVSCPDELLSHHVLTTAPGAEGVTSKLMEWQSHLAFSRDVRKVVTQGKGLVDGRLSGEKNSKEPNRSIGPSRNATGSQRHPPLCPPAMQGH